MAHKLDAEEVRKIRRLHREDRLKITAICRETGHAVDCVKDVILRRRAHAKHVMPFPKG